MKRLGDATSVYISSSVKRLLLSAKRPANTIAKRRFRSGPLLVSVTLSLLLVTLTLSPSIRGTFTRGASVTAFDETISTFASTDCSTPKTSWNLGQTACAVATGSPEDRRIAWVAPDGSVADVTDFYSGTATDSYTFTTGADPLAQVGTWTVQTIDPSGATFAVAEFVVRDPNNASADLSINNFGPFQVTAGANVNYRVELTNKGPDDAQNVTFTNGIPGGTTFVSEAQSSGSGFTCTSPAVGSASGTVSCTIASLPANATAIFTLAFNVTAGASDGTIITSTASISSNTNDPRSSDNTSSVQTTVTGNSAVCTLNCQSNVTANNDANQCSAVVNYSTPSTSGDCGLPSENPVICSPPSGSTFPIGSTTVNCTTQSGGTCSFAVTVNDTRPPVQPTISCPANQTSGEDSPGAGEATVNYPAPATTGNCVTVVCNPRSGTTFTVGTTTVNCNATDSANNTVSCSFTVTVTSGAACTLSCPGDITQAAAAGQCSATVTYSDPSTSGNCGTVTCAPSSGFSFPVGTTTVTCTSSQGPSCDFTVTVNAPAAPTIVTCASNKTVAVDANCEGVIPNLLTEVTTTGCSVTKSQSPAAGSVVGTGTYTVVITAENSAGEVTCNATVTVADNTPPVITTCPAGTSASAGSSCQAPVPSVVGGVVASDNCTDASALTITQSPAAGTLVGAGSNTITITVKDAANNTATCTTTFTVIDTTPPTAVCKNITVALNAGGTASIAATDVDNGSTDNCGITSRTVSPSTFTCANKGPNTVTLTVKDAANNTSTCQATVTVVDSTPPTIVCLADITVNFDAAVGGAVVTYTTPVGTDNCPGATTAQIAGLASGATFPVGTTTNTFRVTDAVGLTAECSFKVTVALTSVIGLDSVSLSGGGLIDSYNSTGGYPATKGSLAKVLSNGTITISGGPVVWGDVRSTRVGVVLSGGSQVTGNATAGTTVSLSGGSTVGGTVTNNSLAPVMVLPAVTACGTYSSNSGITGTYTYSASTGNLTVSGGNIATLANGTYCFNNVTISGGAQLKVNGLVVIKLTGSLNASGGSVTNTTTIPANLRILSSYTGSNGVTLSGGSNAHLVVYAPRTNVTLSGGSPVFGTVVGKTLTLSASSMIHYDTTLLSIWPDLWTAISQ